jgi:hypothetical protein
MEHIEWGVRCEPDGTIRDFGSSDEDAGAAVMAAEGMGDEPWHELCTGHEAGSRRVITITGRWVPYGETE